MREKNPRRHTTAIPVKSMTSSAVHWSCGQYVDAVTGARLKPMSMTTAPVTTGGIAAWMIRAPKRCTARPARKSATPTTKTAPVTTALSPPCGPDRRGHAHEGERTAEIAGHPAARGEQEDGRRDAGHHDREVRVQPHEHRGDERSAEHRNHVLGAEPERTGPGEPLIGPDHGPRCGGFSVAVQGPAHAEAAHGRSLCVRVWVRAVPGAVFVRARRHRGEDQRHGNAGAASPRVRVALREPRPKVPSMNRARSIVTPNRRLYAHTVLLVNIIHISDS